MDILLDEGVPHKLRRALQEGSPENNYVTAQRVNLTGNSLGFKDLNPTQKDAKLLSEAKAHGFDAVITIDKRMQVQQNDKTPINVVTLNVGAENQQTFENIRPLMPELDKKLAEVNASIKRGEPPIFITINAPAPERTEASGQQRDPDDPPEPPKPGAAIPQKEPAPEPDPPRKTLADFRRSSEQTTERSQDGDRPLDRFRRKFEDDTGRNH